MRHPPFTASNAGPCALSLALDTILRLAEIVGLNVGDVFTPDGTPRGRVRIRPEIAKGGRKDVFLPDRLLPKLRKLFGAGRPALPQPISTANLERRVQFAWRAWQVKAGFDRLYSFHSLRHSAVTNVYRASRDLFLAQRFARHVSPLTTVIYTHPSDQELAGKIRGLPC